MPAEGMVGLFHHDLVVLVKVSPMISRIVATRHLYLRCARPKTHYMSQLFINFYSKCLLTCVRWSGRALTKSIIGHMPVILLRECKKRLIKEAVNVVNFICLERWDKWVLSGAYFINIWRIKRSFGQSVIVLEELMAIAALACSSLASTITVTLDRTWSHLLTNRAHNASSVGCVIGVSVFDVNLGAAGKFITQNKLTVPVNRRALALLNKVLLGSLDKCFFLLLYSNGATLLSWRLASLSHIGHCGWACAPRVEVTFEGKVSVTRWRNEIWLSMMPEIFMVKALIGRLEVEMGLRSLFLFHSPLYHCKPIVGGIFGDRS
jgi:hypothetical protein